MARNSLTHLDEKGEARMVDVGGKPATRRRALAEARLEGKPAVMRAIIAGDLKKGDAVATARIAGIMAAKRTSELIPLCHQLALTSVDVDVAPAPGDTALIIRGVAETTDRTGVEMEALTAVSVAALTLYDMAKALDKSMTITGVQLLEKSGGKSGGWRRG